MPGYLYLPVYLFLIFMMCFITSLRYIASPKHTLQEKKIPFIYPLLFCVFLTFWLGYRPISSVFVDTINYANEYEDLDYYDVSIDWRSEWIWALLMVTSKSIELGVHEFFTLI